MTLYFKFDSAGNTVMVQRALFDGSVAVDESTTQYKSWFESLPVDVQASWPAPTETNGATAG